MNIRLTKQEKIRILNNTDVVEIMQRILVRERKIDRDKEHLWVIGLASNNTILFIELVSLGTSRKVLAEPMECFRVAVLKGAGRIILVHNHPNGELTPSPEDMSVTLKLAMAGLILGIPVIDHFIITPDDYRSFVEIGFMDEVNEKAKWLNVTGPIRTKDFESDIRKETLLNTARKLIEEGADTELIRKVTALKPNQIAKLRRDIEEEKANKGKKK